MAERKLWVREADEYDGDLTLKKGEDGLMYIVGNADIAGMHLQLQFKKFKN